MEANLNDEFKKELSACSDDELRDIMIYLIKVMHIRLMTKTHKLVSGFTLSSESDLVSWIIDIDIMANVKPEGHKKYSEYLKEQT